MPEEIKAGVDYQERYKELGDAEIREILLKRKSYQPQAAQAAIQEAISRGILQSEQDLFSGEYNPPPSRSGFLFPDIQNPEQKSKILASLRRIIYILGIIPFAFAVMNYFHGNFSSVIAFAVAGAAWLFFNFMLSKTKSSLILNTMLVVLIIAFGYAIFTVYTMKAPEIMDFIAVIATFMVSLYCLLFARSIMKS